MERLGKIGLIGTGIMGEPMARNLLKAGRSVVVYNRTRSRTKRLEDEGAAVADSPAAVAAACDIIISIVSDSPDVEAVYLGAGGVQCAEGTKRAEGMKASGGAGGATGATSVGADGVVAGLRRGTLCIDMSTISPESARRVEAAVRARGGSFLDAPVSGGKTGAEQGTLAIMVGGDAADLERARPVLDILGKRITHCGPVGFGQLTKLCNQIIVALNLLAVSEAVVFAKKVGLDPKVMLDAVSAGAAGSWAVSNLGPRMVARDFKPMFMVDLQQKDLRITLATAGGSGAPLPGTALVHQLLGSNQAWGEGADGTQALLRTLERLGNIDGGA